MAYLPRKYLAGLSPSEKKTRASRIRKGSKTHHKDPKAYKPWKTDKGKKVKTSSYTVQFRKKYGADKKTLPQKARAAKIPLGILRKVYNRGMAAWRTGHRPGASQQAWGYARVHSFAVKGKTYYTADADLAKELRQIKKRRTN
jgi:hypothetical protein